MDRILAFSKKLNGYEFLDVLYGLFIFHLDVKAISFGVGVGILQYLPGRIGQVAGQCFAHRSFTEHQQYHKVIVGRYTVNDNTLVTLDTDMPAYFKKVPQFFCTRRVPAYIIPDTSPMLKSLLSQYFPEQFMVGLFGLVGKNAAIQGVKSLHDRKLNGGNGVHIVVVAELARYKVFH